MAGCFRNAATVTARSATSRRQSRPTRRQWTAIARCRRAGRRCRSYCRSAGRTAEADNAANVAASLDRLPAADRHREQPCLRSGDTHAAEQMIRQYLQQDPAHVEGNAAARPDRHEARRPGRRRVPAGERLGVRAGLSRRAVRLCAGARRPAEALAQALEQVRQLLAIEPRNPMFRSLEGNVWWASASTKRRLSCSTASRRGAVRIRRCTSRLRTPTKPSAVSGGD